MDNAPSRVLGDHGPVRDVATFVAWRDVEQRVPATDVRPAEIARHHRGAVSLFHHCVIDRFLRRAREGVGAEPQEAEIGRRAGDRFLYGRRHLRLQPRHFVEQHVGAEQEVTGIPQIAFLHIARGGHRIGLFDKARDRMHAFGAERLAGQDVAVAGLRLGRLDAEGDDAAGLGAGAAGVAGGAEFGRVENDVVGCQRQHHRVRIARTGDCGRGRDGRSRSRGAAAR